MSVYLELDGITVSYGTTTALHSLSLAIEDGEFFCLLGPSGCGKTTTLNVVAGFLQVNSGRVLLGGQDVTALPPQQRRIGIVFQNYALFPHMTVAENVAYGLKVQKRRPEEIGQRVSRLLALVRLEGKGGRYPRQLSGGEQQRVAIARALAIEPRLLLLDEPLSNLDARLREEMRNELKRIQRTTGVTTIFVTHDQGEAFGAGDRVAVLNYGRLEQVGTPNEIYRSPKTTFVARFIGRSNTLRGVAGAARGSGTFAINGRSFLCTRPVGGEAKSYVLYLRPEDLQLSREPAARNSVAGTVAEIVYGGMIVSYRVRTEIGDLEVCQLGEGGDPVSVGDTVHVGWAPDAGSLVAEEPNG